MTGGGGYIGSHMVLALLEAGEKVVVIDILSTGFRWAISPEATFYKGDISDKTLLEHVHRNEKIDTIIHFAGSAIVPASVADPLTYYENNTSKSRSLIEFAIFSGIKHFVFSSTAAVYGTSATERPVPETTELRPASPYGRSKLMTEMMLSDSSAAHNFNYVALRYFNVAGADPKGRTGQSTADATHLIKVAVETALGKRSRVTVFGTNYPTPDGTCIRDYIHVTDLVGAHLKALDYLRRGNASLIANCGYGRGYSVMEVVKAVKSTVGWDFPVLFGDRRPGDAATVVSDTTLIREKIGWVPKYDDLEFIVETALEWERHLARRYNM